DEAVVKGREEAPRARVDENIIEQIAELVADRAIDWPVFRQMLAGFENLLNQQIEWRVVRDFFAGTAGHHLLLDAVIRDRPARVFSAAVARRVEHLHARKILDWIQQPVRMIEADSGNVLVGEQSTDQLVRRR